MTRLRGRARPGENGGQQEKVLSEEGSGQTGWLVRVDGWYMIRLW